MAWNGTNVSILGAKTGATDAAPAQSKPAEGTSPNNKAASPSSEQPKKPPAPPAPSVWNGRHAKIIAKNPVAATVGENAPTAPSASSASDISKKEQLVKVKVVSSSPKEDGKSAAATKEDETATNSTTGSASTITTANEAREPPAQLEGNTVVTTNNSSANSSSDPKKDGNDNSNTSSSSEEKTTASTPAPTSSGNGNSNRQHAKNTSDMNANSRRSGNYKAGQRSNNNHSHSGNKQNYSRSNPSNGSSVRRRVPCNGDKPVCSFFLRGMCNRGTSCSFKHDMANASPNNICTTAPAPLSTTEGGAPRRSSPPPAAANNMNFAATTFVPAKRRGFDPHKAMAIKLAKEAQDHEDRSRFVSTAKRIPEEKKEGEEEETVDPPVFSIDVECIATGYGSCADGINDACGNTGHTSKDVPSTQYNDRSCRYPGRIAMVDSEGKVLADITVRPPNDGAGVTSYLTPLTGLTSEMCFGDDAKSLEEAIDTIKGLLPKNGVLVGQAIDHDVEWLGLTPGVDFERMVDISEIFRQRMPANLKEAAEALKKKEEVGGDADEQQPTPDDKSADAHLGFPTYYRHFSLRHVSINLLSVDIQSGVHSPITDAQYSLLLFHKYRNSGVTQLRIVRDGLHRAPITPGFAQEHGPVIDGVCLSGLGYPYKRAGRTILRWYQSMKKQQSC